MHWYEYRRPTYKVAGQDLYPCLGGSIQNEFDLLPSPSALKLHWLRTVWVLNMWAQASSDKITILPPTQYGWIQEVDNGGYSIQYDTDETCTYH